MAKRGVRMTVKQWEEIEPLLPPVVSRRRGGRQFVGHRAVLDGVPWGPRTEARWRGLPEGYPARSTCRRWLQQWHEQGAGLRIRRAYLCQFDECGRLDRENVFIGPSFASERGRGPTSGPPRRGRA